MNEKKILNTVLTGSIKGFDPEGIKTLTNNLLAKVPEGKKIDLSISMDSQEFLTYTHITILVWE